MWSTFVYWNGEVAPWYMVRILLVSLLLMGCQSAGALMAPFGTDAPLPTAEPTAMQMDTLVLNTMLRTIDQKSKHRLHSLLVMRHGKLVVERYYNNATRHTPHDIRSATKSITSLLVGIALDEGAIDSVDMPMMEYLRASYPDVVDKDAITLRHLLTMQSGLDCDDQDRRTRGQEDRMYRKKDWVAYFLDVEPVEPPGTRTRYCTGGVVALGEVLAQATGQSVVEYADARLFAPLGIENYRWSLYDDGQKVDTGGHLWITPQGMARIGQLMLQDGMWEGQQVVPKAWVDVATQPQTTLDENPYGFLWWTSIVPYGKVTVDVKMARGNGGQVIFVVPAYDLVTVMTTTYYNSDKARIPYQLFFEAILPSVEELRAEMR